MTPAPRPAMRAIALALLLLVQLTPVALAVELPYHEELMYDNTVSEAYSVPVSGEPTDYGGAFGFRVADVTKFRAPKIIFIGDAPATMVANPDLQCSGSADVDIKHVDYYFNTAKVGEGRFHYNTHFSGGEPSRVQIWLEITKWNTNYVSTGSATYIITPAFTDLGIGLKHPGKLAPGNATGKQISVLLTRKEMPGRSERVFPGSYIVEYGQYWESAYTVSQANDETYNVFVDRRNYYSNVSISDTSATYHESYGAQNVTVDVFRYTLEPPLTLKITDPYGNVNLRNLLGDPDPGDPDPGDPTVTIYVKSSQTGALLADAHLTILDGQTGATTVNQSLPTGTGSFNLEKAPTLRYLASATAEGYTLLSPIQFGVGDDGTTIILWMSPNAPPDEPIEEGKSMLYGYVQTQGNQQPLAAATVSLDGYGSKTTSSTGFYLFNNVTPGSYTISASAPLHDALSEPVTVDAAPTQHNLALKGHFLLTVTVKDGDTLAALQNATISLSDGQESTQNPATFNVDYGPYVITAAAGGYYPTTQTAYLDKPGTTTATVLMTAKPEPVPPPEMPNYPPHSVRFLCVDEYNRPLQNVTLRAVYQESTNPVDWFTNWLGLSPSVNINSTTLEGTTGLDGSVIFLMVQSIQYRITVAAPAPINMTKTFDIYPKEDQVTIRFQTSAHTPSAMPTYGLTATETDPSTARLALTYNDTTNATTHLAFQVYDHATGDLIHTQTFDASKFPGTVSPTYDVTNTNGAMYRFGFTAQNSAHGEISQYKGITLKGDNLLVDLGFEDRTLYQWLAVLLLFLFAGAFSGTNVKQGAILVPLFGGGLFWFIGWLPITLGATISAIGFLGVLLYMRKSEWKVRA